MKPCCVTFANYNY